MSDAAGRAMSEGARTPESTVPCFRCGTPLRRTRGRTAPELRCPRCRFLLFDYPRSCAGMVVVKDGRALVLRRAHPPRAGALDIPGGFLEDGETFEAAARRELLEETGVRVGRVEALGLYWDRYFLRGFGFFSTMNHYFIGRWKSGVPRAADDAASAEWVSIAALDRDPRQNAWKHMSEVFRDAKRWARRRGR